MTKAETVAQALDHITACQAFVLVTVHPDGAQMLTLNIDRDNVPDLVQHIVAQDKAQDADINELIGGLY